jgi:hypothetical protein
MMQAEDQDVHNNAADVLSELLHTAARCVAPRCVSPRPPA